MLSFLFSYNLPANSADAGFQTQSADNLLEQHVLPARAGQNGMHLDLIRVLNVVASQRLKEQRLSTEGVKQESPHVSFLLGSGGNPKLGVHCALSAVKRFPDGPQTNVGRDNGERARKRGTVQAVSRPRPDSCGTPQRGCSIQPRDIQAVAQDYARPQESDTGNDLPCDAKTIVSGSR